MDGVVKCAICGKKIVGTASKDHVFPRALYKWSECYVSQTAYAELIKMIEGANNQVKTHESCNKAKEDEIPTIGCLHIEKDKMERLEALKDALDATISYYTLHKYHLLQRQKEKCFGCGKKINGQGVLRRIDPDKDRKWENAAIVCHICNTENADFIHFMSS